MTWFIPQLLCRVHTVTRTAPEEKVTLQPGMRLTLSETRPLQADQNQLPTALKFMVYDELAGWFETLDPEHCLSRAPSNVG